MIEFLTPPVFASVSCEVQGGQINPRAWILTIAFSKLIGFWHPIAQSICQTRGNFIEKKRAKNSNMRILPFLKMPYLKEAALDFDVR